MLRPKNEAPSHNEKNSKMVSKGKEKDTEINEQSKKSRINKSLPDKKFEIRNSLLTDLFENPHIKTIKHIFGATLLGFFTNTLARDYLHNNGKIVLGVDLIYMGMGKFHIAVALWCMYVVFTCLCFFAFAIWANIRIKLSPKSSKVQIWDATWFIITGIYYVFSFRSAAILITLYQLPPGSSAMVALEQIRLLMKVHAFIRTNITKVREFRQNSDKSLKLPKFSWFLYFLFCPTLIYRDEYPRTKSIRWEFVMHRLLEVVGVIFYFSFILERFLLPVYKDFGLKKFSWAEIIVPIFESSLAAMVLLVCTFYLVLHSVQNMFAELLTFGDRLFYKDWWTCSNFSEYFRKWNVIVHDWLYTYIYKDCYENFAPGNKTLAKFFVFLISAVVHEWVLTYMFGFFFPALFIQFFFAGTFLIYVNTPKSPFINTLFWYALAFGVGTLVSLYTMEFYARINVPIENPGFKDFFVPRILYGNIIK